MDKTLYFSIGTGRWQEARSAPADLNACMLRAARTPSCYTFLPKECTVTTIGSGIVELAIRVWVAQTGQGGVESLREKEWTVEFRYFQREIQAWPVSML